MAEVLPSNPEGQGSFYNSRKSSPASSSLFLDSTPPLSSSPRSSYMPPPASDQAEHNERISPPFSSFSVSSRNSTSDLASLCSRNTTPASSSLSLEAKYGQPQDFEDDFPQFGSYSQPSASSESSDDQTASATTDTTASDSPLTTPTVADDTAIKHEPSQHVDYLSHDWREEDVWSSWRHIVSQRKVYGQQSRLENAAWRTWVKSKYHLATVSPETLNWLKESDVTWLYGPLQCAPSHPLTEQDSKPNAGLSRNTSFVKKPILKKRSMSEVMLQRSISASSLLKQAAASVQAQGRIMRRSRSHERTRSAYVPGTNSEIASRDQLDYFTSRSHSDDASPHRCRETRHIRFDDTVEQCIAIECKLDDDDEEEEEEQEPEAVEHSSSESDEEGLVMMARKKRPGLRRKGSTIDGKESRASSHNGRKIIETLPSTTLKYRADTPDQNESQQAPALPRSWSASKLSPSPSQETLRPARPSRNFLIDPEEEEIGVDAGDSGWSFGASNPKSSLGASANASTSSTTRAGPSVIHQARATGGYTISRDSIDEDEDAMREARSAMHDDEPYGVEGMRRTESGMFMPYQEDEDDVMAEGLFGRISETVNTAKDIAHVIWNVGWRK